VAELTGTCGSKNGNKTAKINVKNFHGNLTTAVRAQNDTSKTANITFSILHVERLYSPLPAKSCCQLVWWKCLKCVSLCCARLVCNNLSQHTVSVNCSSL